MNHEAQTSGARLGARSDASGARLHAGVDASARVDVPFGSLRLPVWQLSEGPARGTLVVFGGFDSYIEEIFPILAHLRDDGWSVVAFEGPGQGSVLEDQHAPMTADWHRPVGAVLDALGLDDVTLVGISLGGCLAIRAAALEPRVRRVVAFDVLSDFFACMTHRRRARSGALPGRKSPPRAPGNFLVGAIARPAMNAPHPDQKEGGFHEIDR